MREDARKTGMQRKGTRIWYCSVNAVLHSKNILYEVKTKHITNIRHAIINGAWSKINSIAPRIKKFTAFTTGNSNTSCTSVQKI